MKNLLLFFALVLTANLCLAQQKGQFSISANYGLTGNFFVRSYDEISGYADKDYFYKKDFIGTVAGISATYHLTNKSGVSIEYSRSINTGKKNYAGRFDGIDITILDFKLRHVNNFFQAGYLRKFYNKKQVFQADLGLFLLTDARQEIAIERWDDALNIQELNYENFNSMEGGVYLGAEYAFKIDTHFHLGIRTRGYFLISTGTFEAINLTPLVKYSF